MNYIKKKKNKLSQDCMLTIAIPTYKRPNLLYEALKSAVYQSTNNEYEIIVLDNCNEKEFVKQVDKIVNSFCEFKNIKLFRNKSNVGMFGNWNACLNKANGKYISILNDDDLLDSKFVENVLLNIKDSQMLIYDFRVFSEKKYKEKIGGKLRKIAEKFNINKRKKISITDLLFRNPSNGSLGVVMNRKKAILIGGYDSKFYPASDYYFNYKYIEKYGGIYINQKLASYRLLVNESFKKDTLKNFIILDYKLREKICFKYFKNNKLILNFSNNLNLNQASSQVARYILLRECKKADFSNIKVSPKVKLNNKLIFLLLISQYLCILFELFILFAWKFIFLLSRIIDYLKDIKYDKK